MYCNKCGSQFKEGEEFCKKCGNNVRIKLVQQNNINMGNVQNTTNKTPKQKRSGLFIILSIILVVLFLLLIIGNIANDDNNDEIAISLKPDVSDFKNKLNIGDEITIELNIPDGFEYYYGTKSFKQYKKGEVEFRVSHDICKDDDDCFSDSNSFVESLMPEYNKEISLSGVKTATVNGHKYVYKDLKYIYNGTKYYKKYVYLDLNVKRWSTSNYYLAIEIESIGKEITDSMMRAILSIY